MTLSPLECAKLSALIYSSADGFDIYNANGVYVGYMQIDGIDLFVFRGSYNAEDWADDFFAFPLNHPKLGEVHAGMIRGIDACYKWSITKLREGCKAAFIGHSLGGAHARDMAGLFAYDKRATDFLVTFGSPKPGKQILKSLIENSGMTHSSYRHCSDIVPTLPPDSFGYIHTEQWIELNGDPDKGILEGAEDHSINLYVDALSTIQ